MTADILVLGQITIDDVVPPEPALWQRRLGGNALYAAAGARLWCDPGRIGVVARVGSGINMDVASLLRDAGLTADGLSYVSDEPLTEWILYEADGQRQSVPRNAHLRDPGAEAPELLARYLAHHERVSASADDIPPGWLPASAIHLGPQQRARHGYSCEALSGRTKFLSVDPSPHYSRALDEVGLGVLLRGATAFIPSQAEVKHLSSGTDWAAVASCLGHAGLPEVVIKLGAGGALLHDSESGLSAVLPADVSAPLDLTGAGDAFCGAYAACRGSGLAPRDSVMRANVAAAMVIECVGAEEALRLSPAQAQSRFSAYAATTVAPKQRGMN
jgi:sugar/nucleoside kinase (ribokinase family)